MKIALITFASQESTGQDDVGVYTTNLAKALTRLDHHVSVFASPVALEHELGCGGTGSIRPLPRKGALHRFVMHLGQDHPLLQLFACRGIDAVRAFHREHRRNPFDIVEVTGLTGEGALLSLDTSIPFIIRLQPAILPPAVTRGTRTLDRFLARSMEQQAINGATAISCPSKAKVDRLLATHDIHKPVAVVPDGIDLDRFDATKVSDIRSTLGLSPQQKIMYLHGQASSVEGQQALDGFILQALTDHDDLHIILDNRGPYSTDTPSRIFALDQLGKGAEESLYRQADLVFFTPESEDSPYSCLKAMAGGRPTISSNHGCFAEMIRPGIDGYLIPPDNYSSAHEFMTRILRWENFGPRLGAHARTRVEERYTAEIAAGRALHLYQLAVGLRHSTDKVIRTEECQPLGPSNWFKVWWLEGRDIIHPTLEMDRNGLPCLGQLRLDELRFVQTVLFNTWHDIQADWGSPEASFLESLKALYLEKAIKARESGKEGGSHSHASLTLPPLSHPLFEKRLARTFMAQTWRIHGSASFEDWLHSAIKTPGFIDEARTRPSFRRLATTAATLHPCDETFDVLTALYRQETTRDSIIHQDEEFFTTDAEGQQFRIQVERLGLHLSLHRPAVFNDHDARMDPKNQSDRGVTVIIPSYNHEEFIERTIKSVLRQTHPHTKVLVVDDRSPDRTASIADGMGDSRVEVSINRRNRGLGNSITAALAKVDTPYVAILNSDDLFHPNRIHRCLDVLEADPTAMVVTTELHLMDGKDQRLERENTALVDVGPRIHGVLTWYEEEIRPTKVSERLSLPSLLQSNNLLTSSNLFCRTEYLLKKANLLKGIKYCLDWILFLEASDENALRFIDTPLLGYRLHSRNTMNFGEVEKGDFIVEVNRVVAGFMRRFIKRRSAESDSEQVAAELISLLAGAAGSHNDVNGTILFLSTLFRDGRLPARVADSVFSSIVEHTRQNQHARICSETLVKHGVEVGSLGSELWRAQRYPLENHLAEGYQERCYLLQSQLDWARKDLTENRQVLADETACRKRQEYDIIDLTKNVDTLTSRLGKSQEHIARLTHKVTLSLEALQKQQGQSADLQARLDKRTIEAETLESRYKSICAENAALKGTVDSLQEQLDAALTEAASVESKLTDQLSQQQMHVDTLETRIDELATRLKALDLSFNEISSELEERSLELQTEKQSRLDDKEHHKQETSDLVEFHQQDLMTNQIATNQLLAAPEWRFGRFFLHTLKLRPFWLFAVSFRARLVTGAMRRMLQLRHLTRRLVNYRQPTVVSLAGPFPGAEIGDQVGEVRALFENGNKPWILSWGRGPKANLGKADRFLVSKCSALLADRNQYARDRRHFAKHYSDRVMRISATLEGIPRFSRAFTFARTVKAIHASFLHSTPHIDSWIQCYVAHQLLSIPFSLYVTDDILDHPDLPAELLADIISGAAYIETDSPTTRSRLPVSDDVRTNIMIRPPFIYGRGFNGVDCREVGITSFGPFPANLDYKPVLSALQFLMANGVSTRLHLLGGPAFGGAAIANFFTLKRTIKTLNLEDAVLFDSEPTPDKSARFLSQTLFYLHLAPSEMACDSMPPGVVAAMAHGVPILAPRGTLFQDNRKPEGILDYDPHNTRLGEDLLELGASPDKLTQWGKANHAYYLEYLHPGRYLRNSPPLQRSQP